VLVYDLSCSHRPFKYPCSRCKRTQMQLNWVKLTALYVKAKTYTKEEQHNIL
jgi:hypothetical protein